MIFPSLRSPVARARPKSFPRPPAPRKILRVSWRWRHRPPAVTPEGGNVGLYGPRTDRATDPMVGAAT
jgi:hypothetical protein